MTALRWWAWHGPAHLRRGQGRALCGALLDQRACYALPETHPDRERCPDCAALSPPEPDTDTTRLAAVERELTRAGLPLADLANAVTGDTPLPLTASARVAVLAAERDALLTERMRAIKAAILRSDERHRRAIARLTRAQVRRMTEGTR